MLTVEQIQTLLLKTWRLPEDCEIAVGFIAGASGLGLYAWPVHDGTGVADPLFSVGPADSPAQPSRRPERLE